MTKLELKHEKLYMVEMRVFQGWYRQGLITIDEYKTIDADLRKQYKPKAGTLWTDPDLLCCTTGANLKEKKEVTAND